MSQNLTQPEEIDQILRAMAAQGTYLDTLLPDTCWSKWAINNAKDEGPAEVSAYSCGTANSKHKRG